MGMHIIVSGKQKLFQKRKSEKDFKKLVPICGKLSYNLEFEQFLAQSNINKVYKAVWECAAISY